MVGGRKGAQESCLGRASEESCCSGEDRSRVCVVSCVPADGGILYPLDDNGMRQDVFNGGAPRRINDQQHLQKRRSCCQFPTRCRQTRQMLCERFLDTARGVCDGEFDC
eukprot:1324925-Rhodomonas_salina.5